MHCSRQIIVFIILILTGCTGIQNRAVADTLVSTDWLLERIEDPSYIVLHIGSKDSFDSIHIGRSRFIPVREFMVDRDSLRNELPDIGKIDSLLSVTGIDKDSRIVLCYENENFIPLAARLFLTMDYAGLRERTYVLNGGLKKWMDEDLLVTDSVYEFQEGELVLMANADFLIQAEDMKIYLKSTDYMVLDARPVEYYSGKYDSLEMKFTGGHIEGAMSLPFESFLSEKEPHIFVEKDGMIGAFKKNRMDRNGTAVHYCGSGVWASVNYLVSSHLGYKTMFYDGSYEGWENLELPIIRPVSLELLND
jgi:thiosulfate/3-mercaptopyruvate sulfurtransferase